MKKNIFMNTSLAFLLCANFALAAETVAEKGSLTQNVRNAINDLIEHNAVFAKSKTPEHFQGFLDIQNPRVTMVMCSDSRVQMDNFFKGAENDVFVTRNIGNQFATTQGSIEYGVNVLNTPVLIFVGHSHCGAIKAAMADMSSLAPAIRKELETLDVKPAPDDKEGVILNVHNQVEKALDDFKEKVDAGQLAIIGAVYDFRNDYGYGNGQLIIVDLNGKKDAEEIRNSHYFDGLKKVIIGIQKEEPKKAASL